MARRGADDADVARTGRRRPRVARGSGRLGAGARTRGRRSGSPPVCSSCSTGTTATAPPSPRDSAVPAHRRSGRAPRAPRSRASRCAGRGDGGRRRCGGPSARMLVVAEAIGTNPFFTGGEGSSRRPPPASPPTAAGARELEPEHLLVGHGEGLHGTEAAAGAENCSSRRAAAACPACCCALPRSPPTRSAGAPDQLAVAPASRPGRTSRGGALRPASRTGGLSGSARGAAPNDARTRSSGASRVERRPLTRNSAGRADQRLHPLGRKLLSPLRSRGARDRLVHQRAAKVVHAGGERLPRRRRARA